MVKYPPVEHKLPALFDLIVKTDNILDFLREEKVVDFALYKKSKKERREFTKAAEKYVQRQKTGGDNQNG